MKGIVKRYVLFLNLQDVFHIDFPIFAISVNSVQYSVVIDIITNLLVYRDPRRGSRNDRRRKMTLGLEQMSDLRVVVNNVVSLQEKIRQAESMMRYRIHHRKSTNDLHSVGEKLKEIHQVLAVYRDELFVLMESLKELLNLSRYYFVSSYNSVKNSVEVSWRLCLTAKELIWDMVQDDGVKLCRWKFDKTSYVYIQNEDQSSANTLEIDHLHIENCLNPPQGFKDLLSPYLADVKVMDFNKTKSLRVFWREMAPVAGIQVVDHFEINMFPISLNVTYDVAKQLIYYIFPDKKAKAMLNSSQTAPAPEEKKKDSSSTTSGNTSGAEEKSLAKRGKDAVSAIISPEKPKAVDELLQMQSRASRNKSFIYIKMPNVHLCLSYKVFVGLTH